MYTFDVTILMLLHSLSTPWLDDLAITLTQLGGVLCVTVTVGLIIFGLIQQRQPRNALLLALIVGGAGILNLILKLLFQRTRPDLWEAITTELTYSFPSGHAMASSALAYALIILLWRTKWQAAALIIGIGYILVIGLTRVYLGVHFPSDVIGGWIISLLWTAWVHWTVQKLWPSRSHSA
jgi:membrane-associated phospholipid phosphatase